MARIPTQVVEDVLLAAGCPADDAEARRKVKRVLVEAGAVFPGTDFMGAAEAGETLQVKSGNLRRTRDLPPPYGKVRSGPFWIADDIRALARRRTR